MLANSSNQNVSDLCVHVRSFASRYQTKMQNVSTTLPWLDLSQVPALELLNSCSNTLKTPFQRRANQIMKGVIHMTQPLKVCSAVLQQASLPRADSIGAK